MPCYKYALKNKIHSGFVYRYACSNCKVTEHMGISNLTRKSLKSVKQSEVSDHLLECNCSIDLLQKAYWLNAYQLNKTSPS